ncbi:type IV pilus secretin PilQ family protein [Colwellia sp. 4_MG-2023]|uniref:type IV pilus secretin PilQ n=1 Tax=unclassified Colwellia TaxID=196834 RepID=UPI0026E4446E|nr:MULTISPECIES: type IV pilus secretin PilQ family protein [unclassified Colwellia]MDO6507273.1 type IV pilus secretin PilQ family protein [Colwellia sp. 5_MG-2023]MDO6555383.1 type IV pilus secretin PilQ family protein [Colwellia sp. 4_MG-2023]
MLSNKMKNYKIFSELVNLSRSWLSLLTLVTLVIISFNTSAEETKSSQLEVISYNTIQSDQIELVFEFTTAISALPVVDTSMTPAFVKVKFSADNFDPSLQETLVNHAGVTNITLDKTAENIVATINLEKLAVFDVALNGNEFSITLNYGQSANIVETLNPAGEQFINQIESLDFRLGEDKTAEVLIYLKDSIVAVDVHDKLGKVHVEFHNTRIIEDLLYKLDVTDFGTIVSNIETFKDGRNARLVIDVDTHFTFTHKQQGNLFVLSIKEKEKKPLGYLSDEDEFTGRSISLNFQDIPVRTVLQIIADYNDFNLITSDTVAGNITLRLDGVPWDQALDIILKVKGLDKRMQGNILMVAPNDELAEREAKNLLAQQQVEELAPLYSEYVQINYAKAVEFAELIKNEDTSILSERGSVSVDERTNTLLIRDTTKSIEDIKRMVNILDIPVRQVIIEARMVTVKDNINEELGIRWGVTNTDGEFGTSGSLEGTSVSNNIATNTGVGNVPNLTDRLNVNLPVASPAGALAFQVARLADGTILDLELSAMEQESKGEIIASPRITTANQKEAYIEQGVEIPYQEAASSGATSTQFKKAVLSLTVTPHITPDNKIILDLVVTQDTISTVQSGTAPAIDTQRIGTQVLVNNGETIVLGGIYQQSIISSVSKVPVLGDIPYFGWLFRNTSQFNEKKELLIFVTPRIVTEHF